MRLIPITLFMLIVLYTASTLMHAGVKFAHSIASYHNSQLIEVYEN